MGRFLRPLKRGGLLEKTFMSDKFTATIDDSGSYEIVWANSYAEAAEEHCRQKETKAPEMVSVAMDWSEDTYRFKVFPKTVRFEVVLPVSDQPPASSPPYVVSESQHGQRYYHVGHAESPLDAADQACLKGALSGELEVREWKSRNDSSAPVWHFKAVEREIKVWVAVQVGGAR